MGFPSAFQLPLIDEAIEGVDAVVYDADLFADSESGSVTSVGIASSIRGGGLTALALTTDDTSGTPDVVRAFDIGSVPGRLILEVSMYVDFTTPTDPTSGFIELLGLENASNQTALYVAVNSSGRLVTSKASVGVNNAVGNWSTLTDQSFNGGEVRFRLDIDNTNETVTTYHYTGGSWQQANQQSITVAVEKQGQQVKFRCRPLNDMLTEGGTKTVEFRKLAIAWGDADEVETPTWSDLLAMAQLRDTRHSATSGKVDQRFLVRYVPELLGTPSGTITAEVEYDTDPNFGSPGTVSVECASANDYVAVATATALDPLTTYHWRVRFLDGVTEVLETDSASFETMSAPGGDPGTLRIAFGSCLNFNDARTPNGIPPYDRIAGGTAPHLFVVVDDWGYPDGTTNGYGDSVAQTAGATRQAHYATKHEAAFFNTAPFPAIATAAAIRSKPGNHTVDSDFPGNGSTPTNSTLVTDAMVGWDRFINDGMFNTGDPLQDWILHDTAKTRIFFANCHSYHDDGGSIGDEGRQLNVGRMLGDAQQTALVAAVTNCTAPIFVLFCSSPFASDAASPASATTSWGMASAQRQAITDAAEANPNLTVFLACTGHTHWAFVTKQGLPKSKFLNIGAGPLAQIASNVDGFESDYDGGPIWSDVIDNGVELNDLLHRYVELTIEEAGARVGYAIKDGDGATLYSGVFAAGGGGAARNRSRSRARATNAQVYL